MNSQQIDLIQVPEVATSTRGCSHHDHRLSLQCYFFICFWYLLDPHLAEWRHSITQGPLDASGRTSERVLGKRFSALKPLLTLCNLTSRKQSARPLSRIRASAGGDAGTHDCSTLHCRIAACMLLILYFSQVWHLPSRGRCEAEAWH